MANNRFKVDNGLAVSGNAEFYQRIDAHANAHFNNDLFVVSGNLVVNGTLVYANVVVGLGGIRAIADQQDVGNTTNRFNVFGYRVQVDDTLVPLANGVPMGNTTRRFEVFANTINVADAISLPGGQSINSTIYTGTASNANTVGNLAANGIVVRTGDSTAVARIITTGTAGVTITNGNGVSGNPSIDITFQSGLFSNSSGVYVNATSIAVGTLPVTRGGTGGPDRATAINNLLPAQSPSVADYVLRTNGTDVSWVQAVGPTGFTGSRGFTGSAGATGGLGFTGSQGDRGFTGSAGTNGFWGSVGFTGSKGDIGFTGSQGDRGFTGSRGIDGYWGSVGFTGSRGAVGFTGSIGDLGYTGSSGYSGSQGYTGSQGDIGYTGSASTVIGFTGSGGFTGSRGFTGSASTVIGFTGSQGDTGFTGSASTVIGFTGSASTVIGYTGSAGSAGSIGFSGSASTVRGYTGSAGANGYTGSQGATGTFSGSYTGNMAITGAITATGDITAFFSDDRLKTKFGNIESALDKLLTLSGFIFEPNELAQSLGYEKKREVGVSAQEVEAVLPEAIASAPIDSKYMAVKYERLIPLVIEAIKELNDKIKVN
jgi:hypothetical protein